MNQRLLPDLIADSIARFPDAAAVVMGEERLSYAQLDQFADWLAAALVEQGCVPSDRVCVLAPKSPLIVAAMIAVMRAGCVYVPVDSSGPADRSARIVSSTEPAAAFVLAEGVALLDALKAQGTVHGRFPVVELGWDLVDTAPAEGRLRSPRQVRPEDPMHILFTSGSTGWPKGVVVTHGSMHAFISWSVTEFDIRPGDRCSGHSPMHFDLSMFDVYATLVAGGELHLVPPRTVFPRQLAEYILASEIDQLFCVPSALAYLSASGVMPPAGFTSLRRVLCCGEVLPTPVLIDWMSHHPDTRFINLYGPTEATIASSHHTISEVPADPGQPVPIGTACDGEELLILSDDGSAADCGVTADLYIGGVGLSPGYWRDPETTENAFVPDPRPGRAGHRIYRTGDLAWRDDEGTVHFVGRRDSQVKHRGYRIELGEIEAAVAALSAVAEAAVVAIPTDSFEGTILCCAAVFRVTDRDSTLVDLRRALKDSLPSYMIPSRWLLMDALPKNVNGKIDRREIRNHFESELVTGSPSPSVARPIAASGG